MLGVLAVTAALVLADTTTTPEGPTLITNESSTRRVANGNMTQSASAGNISKISITGTAVTQSWAGFYGNVTGTVTLDDSDGSTLYDWALVDPEGEVYATTATSVDWSSGNVLCWNFTNSGVAYSNYTTLDNYQKLLGQNLLDPDAVNNTFSIATSHTQLYVGSYYIAGVTGGDMIQDSACPNVKLLNSSSENSSLVWEEIILWQDSLEDSTATEAQLIFASIIMSGNENLGFDGEIYDFQMIVGEDGHNGNTSDTTYYFYVELQ